MDLDEFAAGIGERRDGPDHPPIRQPKFFSGVFGRAERSSLANALPQQRSRMNLRPPKEIVQPTDAIPPIAIGFDNDLMLAGIVRTAVIFG